MIVEHLLTGLRIGGMVLFLWLGWRVAFESWEVTEQSAAVRLAAWQYYRASIFAICFVMVFLASPENILRAGNYITRETGLYMMCGVTLGACLHAALVHHALDISLGNRPVTWISCASIVGVSALFGLVRVA